MPQTKVVPAVEGSAGRWVSSSSMMIVGACERGGAFAFPLVSWATFSLLENTSRFGRFGGGGDGSRTMDGSEEVRLRLGEMEELEPSEMSITGLPEPEARACLSFHPAVEKAGRGFFAERQNM